MLRDPRGGVEDVSEMAAAGFEWLALNVGDHDADEWATVRGRAAAADVVCLPWARLGVPDLGHTTATARAKLELLVEAADAWGDGNPLLVANVETEVKPPELGGIISPAEVAEGIGDRPAAVSSEAWTYAMEWGPLAAYPLLLQVFPADNRWAVEEIAERQEECVRRARAYGFRHVGTTFQAYAGARPEWYDLSGTAWSLYAGDDVGAGSWSGWARTKDAA